MGDINQQIGDAYKRLVDVYYPQLAGSGWTTTLDLYRRSTASSVNDLGVPVNPWVAIFEDQPCTIVGIKETSEGGFAIPNQGATQFIELEVVCSILTVKQGDNVVLASTGLAYNVVRAAPMGTLTYLQLNHAQAQVQV